MPVSYDSEALKASEEAHELAFGAAPHFVLKQRMEFDPMKGGWIAPTAKDSTHRANSAPNPPPHWAAPTPGYSPPRLRDKHIEKPHYGEFRLDMKTEVDLGIMPPKWSTTSKMDDPRPLGKQLFECVQPSVHL